MPPPQFEVELVDARTTFNEALARPAPASRGPGERYSAMLDRHLDALRKRVKSSASGRPDTYFSSAGAAAKVDYRDSIAWALAEKERVSEALQKG